MITPEERKRILKELGQFMREHLNITLELQHTVNTMRIALENTDPEFRSKFEEAAKEVSQSEQAYQQRLGHIQRLVTSLEKL